MIADWRMQWNQGKFPFYYVQIAPWEYNPSTQSQALREAQLMSMFVPNTGMAVTLDIGDEKDIHPKNKQAVGDRLARWALVKTYGQKDIIYSGPQYKSMKIKDNEIHLTFDYVDGGLMFNKLNPDNFTIAGEDQKFVPAKAVIQWNQVIVSSDAVENPVAVRYGWSNWTEGTLFNRAELPASSFRTDDWPLE
jgi:sialate O-acetylesterase